MDNALWIVIHTPADKRNVIAGPFDSYADANMCVSDEFDYTCMSFHNSLESALQDTTKWKFEKMAE